MYWFSQFKSGILKGWFPIIQYWYDCGFNDGSCFVIFYGYNQIFIPPKDQFKTTFITPQGIFCWVMMPFGLKNPGGTYQHAMTLIFHDYIHKNLEDYVDNILAKSIQR